MRRFTISIIALLISGSVIAQPTDLEKIPSLFSHYNPNTPGYAIGIVYKGDLIFSEGYGSANLDYNIPITDTTVFYIGSLGKHFTTAALLQLEQKNLISFDDPISNYVYDFPDYGSKIKIKHLIHHTSGIRGTNSLQLFQGIDQMFEEKFDTDDLVDLIIDQEELNFHPGQEFRYSSGGYAVLAKIVENVSGQTFRAYLDQNIFKPLGMSKTFVSDNNNEVIQNRATSYWPDKENSFERRSLVFSAYGDGGIMTTVQDFYKWNMAFNKDLISVNNFSEKMYSKGLLNNGEEITYALALNVIEIDSRMVVMHGGGMLGYRAGFVQFPEDSLTVIAFSNVAFSDPIGKAFEIYDLIMPSKAQEVSIQDEKVVKEVKSSIKNTGKWAGKYFSEEINQWRRITFSNDSLFWDSGNLNNRLLLNPIGDSAFSLGEDVKVELLNKRGEQIAKLIQPTVERSFYKFDDSKPNSIEEMEKFVGAFYSNELNTQYEFFIQEQKFFYRINDGKKVEIFPNPKDQRINWNSKHKVWVGFGMITFIENDKGEINALEIGDYRVNGVIFSRIR